MRRPDKRAISPAAPTGLDTLHLARALAPREGYNLTALADVRVLRSDRPLPDTPVLYDPGIVVVLQGAKRGFFGDQVIVYDQDHYLAVAAPVPFTMQSDGSPQAPLLALYLHLDFPLAAELLIELDQQGYGANGEGDGDGRGEDSSGRARSLLSSPMDADMRLSVQRLLQVLSRPLEAALLGRSAVRELYFRVLTGPQGRSLRAALTQQGQFGKVGMALRRIHRDYASRLDLGLLAREAGMSVPSFHVHFKAVTQSSPMQYLKSTRLHQARLLMAREGMTVAAACHAVGYESPSQFNREFKRLFGLAPAAEARRMKGSFHLPPAHPGSGFVSSH